MEETKIENGPTVPAGNRHHHEGHGEKCSGYCGHHCGHMGYHFVKAIIIVFAIILLLSIGAAMGARHGYRGSNNGHFYGNGGGCGFRTEVPSRGPADGRFYMMGNAQVIPTTETIPGSPLMSGTATQTAPLK